MSAPATKMLDVRRLTYFYHSARLGSFGRAAQYLEVAQPALSRHVQLLEADLGAILLQRHPRGVTLTQLGSIVYERTGAMLQLLHETRHSISEAQQLPTGKVKLAVLHTFAEQYTPELIEHIQRTYPAIQLQVIEAPTHILGRALESGEADLGVIVASPKLRNLVQESLLLDRLHLVGSTSVPLPVKGRVTLKKLQKLPLALAFSRYSPRQLIDQAAKAEGIQIQPTIEIDSLYLMKQVIAKQGVFSILPKMSCAREIKSGRFFALPIDPKIELDYALATLHGATLTLAARVVAREIRQITKAILEHEEIIPSRREHYAHGRSDAGMAAITI